MIHKAEVVIPARTEVQTTHVTCDLCGARGREDSGYEHASEWAQHHGSSYDEEVTAVRMKIGHNCPDGGSWSTTTFDICRNCFETRLMPWLAEQGATPRTQKFADY